MPHRVILDCDPGHDDAIAILLAHGHPEVELLAITTVAGNQTLDKTTHNARRVATLAAINGVPIAAGCDRPLLRELVTAGGVHGESGLDGADLPEPSVPLADAHAVELIIDLVTASPGEVTLVPTGPLTNVAVALRREPRLARLVREVVLMGGSYTRGNLTPAAEFNVAVDPEAAAIVFEAGWPLTMIGLDLTHQAQATPEVVERISAVGTPVSAAVVQLLQFYGRRYRERTGAGAPPVHDPCTIARLVAPEVVECVDAFVAVETQGRWTSGMTVTEFGAGQGRPCNAKVATRLDFQGFWDLVVDALDAIRPPEPPESADA